MNRRVTVPVLTCSVFQQGCLDKPLYAIGQFVVALEKGRQSSAPCLEPTTGMELENCLSSVQTRRDLVPGERSLAGQALLHYILLTVCSRCSRRVGFEELTE